MSNLINRNISTKNSYRPEIDGLRAFAILAVIINHFNKEILPGGYLGIDIFFVISGFVITSSLNQRPSKKFKDFITRFYSRRIKRLVPALSVFVLIMSILICLFIPQPILSLRTGITSLFGLSNLYLLRQSTDYFAQSTELNIFTHTWSLSVEEQYYIVFPFLIWFSGFGSQTTNGSRNLFLIVGALSIASLIGFIYLYPINQPAAYFLMPTRFWEMGAGCLLFITLQRRESNEQALSKLPPIVVLILIVAIMHLPLSWETASTVAVVSLAVVLIATLKKQTTAYIILTHPKVIFIGLISYSLYLWHWGVLSISRWTIGLHWWSLPFQVLLIISLAVASYQWIETPLHKGKFLNKRWRAFAIGGGIIVTLSGSLITLTKSIEKSYLEEEKKQKEPPFAGNSIKRKNCMDHPEFNSSVTECWLNKENEAKNLSKLFFIGDSHNESFSQAAEFLSEKIDNPIFFHSRRGTIFPVIGEYWEKDGGLDMGFLGRKKNNIIQREAENYLLSAISSDDILIITLRLPYYFGADGFSNKKEDFIYKNNNGYVISRDDFFNLWKKKVLDLATNLESKNAKMIISTPTPEWNDLNVEFCRPRQWFNLFSYKNCVLNKISLEEEYRPIMNFLKTIDKQSQNVYILNSLSSLCPKGICKYTKNDEALYRDRDHLSNYSSRNIIGPKLLDLINKM